MCVCRFLVVFVVVWLCFGLWCVCLLLFVCNCCCWLVYSCCWLVLVARVFACVVVWLCLWLSSEGFGLLLLVCVFVVAWLVIVVVGL